MIDDPVDEFIRDLDRAGRRILVCVSLGLIGVGALIGWMLS